MSLDAQREAAVRLAWILCVDPAVRSVRASDGVLRVSVRGRVGVEVPVVFEGFPVRKVLTGSDERR